MAKELIFLDSPIQKSKLRQIANNPDIKIISTYYPARLELKRNNLKHQDIFEFVEDSEFSYINALAAKIARNWYKNFEPIEIENNIPFFELFEKEIIYYLCYLLTHSLALKKIIKIENPENILLIDKQAANPNSISPKENEQYIDNIIEALFPDKIRYLNIENNSLNRSIAIIKKKSALSYFYQIYEKFLLKKIKKIDRNSKLVLINCDTSLKNLFKLFKDEELLPLVIGENLNKFIIQNFLPFLCINEPVYKKFDRDFDSEFNNLKIKLEKLMPKTKEYFEGILQNEKLADLSIERLTLNITSYVSKIKKYYLFFGWLFDNLSIKGVVVSHDTSYHWKLLVKMSNNRNIPSFVIPHGHFPLPVGSSKQNIEDPFPYAVGFYPISARYFFPQSEYHKEWISENWGVPFERLLTGCPPILGNILKPKNSYKHNTISLRKTILYLPRFNGKNFLCNHHMRYNHQFSIAEELFDAFDKLKNLNFIIKYKDKFSMEKEIFDYYYNKRKYSNIKFTSSFSLDLNHSRILCGITHWTSFALELMARQIPVICFNPTQIDQASFYHYYAHTPLARNKGELIKEISMIKEDKNYGLSIITKQNEFLEWYISKSSTKELISSIKNKL